MFNNRLGFAWVILKNPFKSSLIISEFSMKSSQRKMFFNLRFLFQFLHVMQKPKSSTESETDSILLNSSRLHLSFFAQSLFFFLSFRSVFTLKCPPPEWSSLAGPPPRLSCHHRSYFWALNRLSPSDPITCPLAPCRVKAAALCSFFSLLPSSLHHHPTLPLHHSQFLLRPSMLWMFRV